MFISDIFSNIPDVKVIGNNGEVSSLSMDTREGFSNETMFIAIPGIENEGHHYIDQAIENGAVAIACETLPDQLRDTVTYVQIDNVTMQFGYIASAFYGNPSHKLTVIGITGTNGKTTVATTFYQAFEALGHPTGLLSTIGNKIHDKSIKSTHTTGSALQIQKNLSLMVEAGCTHVAMEVSSHALEQYRTNGIDFDIAIFTNLTQDHLDYHGTMKSYASSKKKFFDSLSADAIAITNIDDDYGVYMVQNTKARVISYGKKHDEILSASCISIPENYTFELISMNLDSTVQVINDHEIVSPFVGKYNAYNLTALYASLRELGHDAETTAETIGKLESPKGRMELFKHPSDNIIGVVDYAHTPDALLNVLKTLKELPHRQIITVIGCGGDRDKGKRPQMAKIVQRHSDFAIFTSDNPRTEDPQEILNDMVAGVESGLDNYEVIEDRETAIKHAVGHARSDDIILVAGKGHEDYQIIGTEKTDFSDHEMLQKYLK